MIYLIRHGKTEANEKRLYCGKTDVPLSDTGARLLYENKERGVYENLPKDAVYITSGLLRAKQTLQIIAGGVKAHVIDGLNEIDFGDFEMKAYGDLRENADYIRWLNDYQNENIPNGESFHTFKRRVFNGIALARSLCEASGANGANGASDAVIVTHGGVIALLTEKEHGGLSFFGRVPDFGGAITLAYNSSKHY